MKNKDKTIRQTIFNLQKMLDNCTAQELAKILGVNPVTITRAKKRKPANKGARLYLLLEIVFDKLQEALDPQEYFLILKKIFDLS